jgi:hypothetical protein
VGYSTLEGEGTAIAHNIGNHSTHNTSQKIESFSINLVEIPYKLLLGIYNCPTILT